MTKSLFMDCKACAERGLGRALPGCEDCAGQGRLEVGSEPAMRQHLELLMAEVSKACVRNANRLYVRHPEGALVGAFKALSVLMAASEQLHAHVDQHVRVGDLWGRDANTTWYNRMAGLAIGILPALLMTAAYATPALIKLHKEGKRHG